MLATVDWTGDGDDADFVLAIERIFDLRLPQPLLWTSFGDVHDHMVAHIAARGGGGTICATQMTFYRLRKALRLGRHVTPYRPAADCLASDLRATFRNIEAVTDLKMPALRWGWRGVAGALSYTAAGAITLFSPLAPPFRIFATGAAAHAGLWLHGTDRRRLPSGCVTLGDLARLIADDNRGRLARDGARLSEAEIWQIIQQLAADQGGQDPSLIGKHTTFFREKAAAA